MLTTMTATPIANTTSFSAAPHHRLVDKTTRLLNPNPPPTPLPPTSAPHGSQIHIRSILSSPAFGLQTSYVDALVGRIEQRFELYGPAKGHASSPAAKGPTTSLPRPPTTVPSRAGAAGEGRSVRRLL